MKNAMNFLITGLLTLTTTTAFAGTTQIGSGEVSIKCRADVSVFEVESSTLVAEIFQDSKTGKTVAYFNGSKTNEDVKAVEYSISQNALVKANLEDDSLENLNDGERRLAHFLLIRKEVAANEAGVEAFVLDFDIKDVVKVRLYDLLGNSDKDMFGGGVLVEALDAKGDLLGRILSSVLPAQCK